MGGKEGAGGPSLDSSPLLPTLIPERGGSGSSGAVGGGGEKDLFCSLCTRSDDASGILAEVRRQLWLAGPLIAVSLLHYSIQVISVMFVGHLGELPLSGASMATSFANVTGFSVLLGMASALDPLCGQGYGAKQYHMLGIHMQRAMLVLLLASIPLAFILAYTSQILMAVGQNPEISMEAGLYACWLIPGLFAYGLLQCHVRFLQTQNIVFPMLLTSGITVLFHIIVCWILVYKSDLGNKGAAMATTISYWINVFLLATYVKFSQACKETWTGLSVEALHDVLNFLRLAVPSAFMTCLEYWSFEMVVLLAGLLPNPKLETSVLSISLNTMWIVYMIPTGLSSAVSIRVSNELGAGNPQAACLSVYAALIMAITEGLMVALITILVRHVWGYLYSNEEEVAKYISIMMPILATSDFMDGIQCTLSGAARGCGMQKICSLVNLGAYYVVGIPSAILFAFVLHVGGQGLWMGIICALIVQVSILVVMMLCINWNQEARKAKDRAHNFAIAAEAI
ncbi:protein DETOXIFICATION 16-like [Phoenix dactylifera]|uniref:Protein DETOXIFICATION n=1 Tax=Phoenix dactylifera TaxID=42345 RepID=A0A8B7BG79_PHODC|nr:protein DETOXIFICATION 16-like [Phoenix dactylifera]XP_038984577.1 protein DETOXIFICATION 16-like [Phoenix dactylifera]